MTKKCYFCGVTKGLKAIWTEGDEGGFENHSSCKDCFFDNELENESIVDRDNWDYFNYNWKAKKSIPKSLITNTTKGE